MMIEFKTEASLWEMMADINPFTGGSAKPFDMRRWDISDDRIYRLSWGETGGAREQIGDDLTGLPWFPDEKEVGFVNKTTGEIIAFEYQGVLFPSWAPGWGFLQLGRCTFLAGKRMGAEP